MRMRWTGLAAAVLFAILAGRAGIAQEATPGTPPDAAPAAPAPEPAMKEPKAYRPIEGPVIINLPSVDVPAKGTLTLLFAHRFSQPVQNSSINTLFSFDSAANIGIGLGYAPVKNLALFFYRYSNDNTTYEVSGKYRLLSCGPLAVSLGAGGDFRTVPNPPLGPPVNNRSTFFAQAIFAYTPTPWLRITAEPMYINHTSGLPGWLDLTASPTLVVRPEPFYANVFNVPIAASVAITHSIAVHGEVVPSYSRNVIVTQTQGCGGDLPACPTATQRFSPGVGWVVSVEKSLLRHRFAFMAGNMRETTVDQYVLPTFSNGLLQNPKNVYLGFYLVRQWSLSH